MFFRLVYANSRFYRGLDLFPSKILKNCAGDGCSRLWGADVHFCFCRNAGQAGIVRVLKLTLHWPVQMGRIHLLEVTRSMTVCAQKILFLRGIQKTSWSVSAFHHSSRSSIIFILQPTGGAGPARLGTTAWKTRTSPAHCMLLQQVLPRVMLIAIVIQHSRIQPTEQNRTSVRNAQPIHGVLGKAR